MGLMKFAGLLDNTNKGRGFHNVFYFNTRVALIMIPLPYKISAYRYFNFLLELSDLSIQKTSINAEDIVTAHCKE